MKPLLSAAASIEYEGARGKISLRGGKARMPIYFAEADGLDFRLIAKF
jgi:hypothetical protein